MDVITYKEFLQLNNERKKKNSKKLEEIEEPNYNFSFERPYNEGIEWKLKKEMQVLCLFKEYRIIPVNCEIEPITDDEWIEAFANIRLLHSLVNEKSSITTIFCVRLNTMILKRQIKNKGDAKKLYNRLENKQKYT